MDQFIFATNSLDVCGRVAVVLWGLWVNRNNTIWSGRCNSAVGIVNLSCRSLEEWLNVQKNSTGCFSAGGGDSIAVDKWIRPNEGWLKANTDISIPKDSNVICA